MKSFKAQTEALRISVKAERQAQATAYKIKCDKRRESMLKQLKQVTKV